MVPQPGSNGFGKKRVTSCNLSSLLGCGFLASSDALPPFLCGGIETSLLPVSKPCVTSFPPPASLFPQSRLSNERFRFIKGSFENMFSSGKKKKKKVGAHLALVGQAENEGCEKPSPFGADGLIRLLIKYTYRFLTALLSVRHPPTTAPLSQYCSYPLQTPPGYVLISVIGELWMYILLH